MSQQSDGQASWEPRAESGRHASTRDDLFPFIEEEDNEVGHYLVDIVRLKADSLLSISSSLEWCFTMTAGEATPAEKDRGTNGNTQSRR